MESIEEKVQSFFHEGQTKSKTFLGRKGSVTLLKNEASRQDLQQWTRENKEIDVERWNEKRWMILVGNPYL